MGDTQDDIQVILTVTAQSMMNQNSIQTAPSLEEGPGLARSPSSPHPPSQALPLQSQDKCTLGFCRDKQACLGALGPS